MIFSDQTLSFLLPGPRIWVTLVILRSNSLSKAKGKIPYPQKISSVCSRWNALWLHHALSPPLPPPSTAETKCSVSFLPPKKLRDCPLNNFLKSASQMTMPNSAAPNPSMIKRNCMPRAKKDPGLKMNRYDWWLIYKGRCWYTEHVWRLSTAVTFHICSVMWQFLTPEVNQELNAL